MKGSKTCDLDYSVIILVLEIIIQFGCVAAQARHGWKLSGLLTSSSDVATASCWELSHSRRLLPSDQRVNTGRYSSNKGKPSKTQDCHMCSVAEL